MSDETITVLLGYKDTMRRYLLQAAVVCGVLCVVLLVLFGEVGPIPLLIALGSLAGEMWWRNKKPVRLSENGLVYGEETIPWSDVIRYTTWGPVGIPWTPIKIQGVSIYLKNGTAFSFYSASKGFNQLMQKLESQKYPPLEEPVWYQYSPRLVRAFRYVVAFAFALVFLLVFALKMLVILVLVVGGYFVVRFFVKSKREKGEALPADAWIAAGGSILLFCVLYFISSSPYLLFLLSGAPVAIIIWFPWKPSPLAIIGDAVFVGEKKAYPLRHLRTIQTISKFFIIKALRLTFANGDVVALQMLENFEEFKQKIERNWNDVQQRYKNKKMSEDETEIRTPEDEARKIHFFKADKITLGMPIAWQFWLPFFFLIHLVFFGMALWVTYETPAGKVAYLGLFLRTMMPVFLIVYADYILFSLIPRLFRLPQKYEMDDEGIATSKRRIAWSEIESVVPHKDADGKNRVALLDENGKVLLIIWQEMSDWELALQKIKEKVRNARKNDVAVSGAMNLLNKQWDSWRQSRRLVVSLAILVILAISISWIVAERDELLDKETIAVTGTSEYVIPRVLGDNLLLIPYQTYYGETWYSLAFQKESGKKPLCTQITLYYLATNPIHSLPCGAVEDPRVSILNFLQDWGIQDNHVDFLEGLVQNSVYFFGAIAVLLLLVSVLHRGIFAGLITQKIPPILGPFIYLHAAVKMQNTIRMVLHLAVILFLGLLTLYMLMPGFFPVYIYIPIPVPFLWILIASLLPVFLCPYLVYYFLVITPDWLRSFKRWKMDDDGIGEGRKNLKWDEIKSVAVFQLPSPSPLRIFQRPGRSVALISGDKAQICLDGELVHFEEIVKHIRKKSGCKHDEFNQARRFMRKKYSLPKLARMATCMVLVILIPFLFLLTRHYQEMTLEQGQKAQCRISFSFFKKFAAISYTDNHDKTWYTFVWRNITGDSPSVSKTEANIVFLPQNPAYWTSEDWKIDSFQQTVEYMFPGIRQFFNQYGSSIQNTLLWTLGVLLLLMLLPLCWFLIGTLWGIPSLRVDNPTKQEKGESLKTEDTKKN